MKHPKLIFLLFLLAGAFYCTVQVFAIEQKRRALQEDLVELSKAKYGLFNVDEWKAIVATVVTKKVEELDLSEANKKVMKKRISNLLTTIITDLEKSFKKENEGSFKGFFKNAGADLLDVFGKMKRDIPAFTNQIMKFLEDKQNRRDLKDYILKKVDTYADDTFAETDYTIQNEILARRNYTDRPNAVKQLTVEGNLLELSKKPYTYALYIIFLVLAGTLLFCKPKEKLEWLIAIAIALLPLVLGIVLPMIEIDARIAELKFQLLGERVGFSNQVLFFKSKSIIEVVELMFAQGKADLVAVGILVMAFSVLFPFAKITASLLYIFSESLRQNKTIRILVFKTGKWSMADVMVVAIFMSYIGFSGIISEQLSQLEGIAKNADVLTTNKSSLQTGFFMFSSFVLLSLILSNALMGRFAEAEYLPEIKI